MRLWSLHPKYLDTKGLIALWREALLAQEVIAGKIKAFKNHPQLKRFKSHSSPGKAIKNYLMEVWKEAKKRGYNFDKTRIGKVNTVDKIPVTKLQLKYELELLRAKIEKRDPSKSQDLSSVHRIECHPLFTSVEGGIEEWEKVKTKIG